jgi:hypothetical protein
MTPDSTSSARNFADTSLERKEHGRPLPPVMVIREDNQPVTVPVRFDRAETGLAWRVVLENGTTIDGTAGQKILDPAPDRIYIAVCSA